VKNFTRVRESSKMELRYKEKRIFLPSVLYVDSTFMQLFDFQLLQGDRNKMLENINTIVLTRESAKKIFGNENPIGKSITKYSGDTITFTITGILKDVPENSHMQNYCKPGEHEQLGRQLDGYLS
jgi:putative ABC transport system permease protein